MAWGLTGQQTTTTTQPTWLNQYANSLGSAAVNQVIDPATGLPRPMNQYEGQTTAPINPLLQASQQKLFGMQTPDFSTVNTQLVNAGAQAQGAYVDPNSIQFNGAYTQGAYGPTAFTRENVQFNDPLAGYKPDAFLASAATMNAPAYSASTYNFNPQQVAAERIAAAQRSGIRDVQTPTDILAYGVVKPGDVQGATGLQAYLMNQPKDVIAPELRDFLINQPGLVSADKLGPVQTWTQADQAGYMNPYTGAVTDIAKRKATEDFYSQLTDAGSRAAAAGAFGGSRQAVLEGQMRRDYATQLSDMTTQGLDAAYRNAQAQWAADRAAQMQGSQFDITNSLQANLANQGALLDAAKANQAAQLGVQQLGATNSLQAQMANQAAGLDVGKANQAAQLSIQELMAQQGLQAALANQGVALDVNKANSAAQMAAQQLKTTSGLQAAMANQGADVSYAQQLLDAQRANQAASLQAGMANQSTGLEAMIKGASLTQSDKQFGANQAFEQAKQNAAMQQQTILANQAAQLDAQRAGLSALQTQYGGNLQAGIANQNAGLEVARMGEQSKQFGFQQGQQDRQFAADFGLNAAKAQADAQANATRNNLTGAATTADIFNTVGRNDQAAFTNAMTLAGAQLGAGETQQARDQAEADRNFQLWQLQQQYPMLSMQQLSQILGSMPNMSTQSTDIYGQKPGWAQMLTGGLTAAAGLLAPIKIPGLQG